MINDQILMTKKILLCTLILLLVLPNFQTFAQTSTEEDDVGDAHPNDIAPFQFVEQFPHNPCLGAQ